MRLALFDIDETLILNDSETQWCRYLTREGIYDMSRIDDFTRDYHAGELDFPAFAAFQLQPLVDLEEEFLLRHREHFLETEIVPNFCERLKERVARHQAAGDHVLVVSAAHDFLAEPITAMAGISEGLFTVAERSASGFTGRVAGHPCYREGKLLRVTEWLRGRDLGWEDLEDSCFYSDSHNDLPLLQHVQRAVAVRPDAQLRRVAEQSGWEVIA